MKYLKLFENFDGEDPKWIITSALDPIEVDEIPFHENVKGIFFILSLRFLNLIHEKKYSKSCVFYMCYICISPIPLFSHIYLRPRRT